MNENVLLLFTRRWQQLHHLRAPGNGYEIKTDPQAVQYVVHGNVEEWKKRKPGTLVLDQASSGA